MDEMSDINLNEDASEENGELRRSLTSLDGWDFDESHEISVIKPITPTTAGSITLAEKPSEVALEEKPLEPKKLSSSVMDKPLDVQALEEEIGGGEEEKEEEERGISPPIHRHSFSPTGSNISRASSIQATDQLSSYSLPGATLNFHQQPYSHYHHPQVNNYGGYYGQPPPQHGPPYHPNHYQPYGHQLPPPQNPNFYQPIPQYSNYPGYGAPSPAPGMYPYYPMQGYDQSRQRPYPHEYSRPAPQRFDPNSSSSSFDRSFGPSNFQNTPMAPPSFGMSGGGYPSAPVPSAYPSAFSGNHAANNLPPGFAEWYKQYVRWWSRTQGGSEAGGSRHRLTPPLYTVRHSRVTFGPLNQLVVASGQNIIIHHLQPSLIDVESKISISTWPGPLVMDQTDKADVMEFVKAQDGQHQTIGEAIEVSIYDKQKRQIWQILKMLVQLNGNVSGSDIAELLFYHNEAEFSKDENSDMNQYRRLLTLGQRKNALEFATKSGLWDHFMTLTCLTLPRESLSYSHPPFTLLEAASKFIHTTLNNQDALYVLYRCLLNKLRTYYNKHVVSKPLPISSLHHFTILLANECEINSVVPAASSELLNFVIALRNNDSQHLITISPVASHENSNNSENRKEKLAYSEELVFINEIFEYSRNCDEIIVDFIPYKVLFTCKLFDYGFLSQAKRYCEKIREAVNFYTNQNAGLINYANVNWDLVTKIIDDLESRITGSLIGSPSESFVASSEAVAGDDDPTESEISVDHLTEGVGGMSVGGDEENIGSLASSPRKSVTSSMVNEDQSQALFARPNSNQFARPEPVSFLSRPEPFNILSTQSSLPSIPTPVDLPPPTPVLKPPSPQPQPPSVNSIAPINNYSGSAQPPQQQQHQPQSLQATSKQQQNFNQPTPFNQSSSQFNNNQRQNQQSWQSRQRSNSTLSSVAGDFTNTPPQTPRVAEPSPWTSQPPPPPPPQLLSQPPQFQPNPPFSQPHQQSPFQSESQQQPTLPQPQAQSNQDYIESGQTDPMSYISVQTTSYDLNRHEESETGPTPNYKTSNVYNNFNSTTTNGLAAPSISTPVVSPIASPSTDYNQMRSSNSFDISQHPIAVSRERVTFEDKKSTPLEENKENKSSNSEGDTIDAKQQAGKQKGMLDFIFSKLPSLPKRAVLPDDKDPSIVWDDNLKQWLNKDEKEDPNSQNVPSGPPKIPMFNSMGQFAPQPQQPQSAQLSSNPGFNSFQNSQSHSMMGQPPNVPPLGGSTSFNYGESTGTGFPAMDPSRMSFVKSKQKRWVDINSTTISR